MSSPEFHLLTITSVRAQSDMAVSLAFSVPVELEQRFRFIPGQYLTLRAEIDGQDVRRSYSICSSVSQGDTLEVGIKSVPGGMFSNYAMGLAAGDNVEVMTPQGRFTAEIGGQHRYLLLAVGSGITPCLSIARSVLEEENESEITLVYGNRTSATMMFRDDVHGLKDRYMERFRLLNVMSAEQQQAQLLNGRIDGSKVAALTEQGVLNPASFDGCYICGPQQMMERTSAALESLGVDKSRIHIELFVTDNARQPAPAPSDKRKVDAPASGGIAVTVLIDGVQQQVLVDPAIDTVLSAAQRAGLDLPFSCAGGMCCTCRCKVKAGATAMDLNYSLAQWEIDAGYTLACQTRPLNDSVILDFDAA